ncbi:MAG: glycosyltransferase family 2 protein [Sulfurospirillaceae bacterium]|nr:glycosyltransferase family 2 protein [Sulfurospirillaceae bacterium]
MLLTLGLPVYNGEKCIANTIESIVLALQKVSKPDLIEILVSDNSSLDSTRDVVNHFIFNGVKIQYFCNEKNIGYDGNIDAIVKKANGKYVWFLGCGEKVKEDALQRLIEKLMNDADYTNILLDFDIYDERKDKITDERIYTFNDDIVLEGKNNFLHNKYGPAVSSNIINKNLWNEVSHEQFVVDGWCHIERILSMIALKDDSKTLILPNPYFILFREKNGWWTKPNSYLLLLLHVKVIRSMIYKGYDKKIVKYLESKQSRIALLMAIVQSKEFGMKLSKKIMSDMLELFKYDYFFWLVALPLLLMPRQLMWLPRNGFKILKICKSFLKYVKNSIF